MRLPRADEIDQDTPAHELHFVRYSGSSDAAQLAKAEAELQRRQQSHDAEISRRQERAAWAAAIAAGLSALATIGLVIVSAIRL